MLEALWNQFSGLRPQAWLCLDSTFHFEEIKKFILLKKNSLIENVFFSLEKLCCLILGISPENVLSPLSREEGIKVLLSQQKILKYLPEFKKRRKRKDWIRTLDRTLQQARMSFSHWEEAEVYHEILKEKWGDSELRNQLYAFTKAYESWLEVRGYWDLPLLLKKSIEKLKSRNFIAWPQQIVHLTLRTPQSLEMSFWETLNEVVSIKKIQPDHFFEPQVSCQRWHSLDDAVEALADEILKENWEKSMILIPDHASVRRSLFRALEKRAIPIANFRVPNFLLNSELLKKSFTPLEVVARRFHQDAVIAWIYKFQPQKAAQWIPEIYARGIQFGLKNYQGGILTSLYQELSYLNKKWGGRKTFHEISQLHFQWLEDPELMIFFKEFWRSYQWDLQFIGNEKEPKSALYWYENIQRRSIRTPLPFCQFRPASGVQIAHLDCTSIQTFKKIWILAMPSSWLNEGLGDEWFSEKQRDQLEMEFSIRGRKQIFKERKAFLKNWFFRSEKVNFFDVHYHWDGKERNSIETILSEFKDEFSYSYENQGAYCRIDSSYFFQQKIQPQDIMLPFNPPLKKLNVSTLEYYSRCSFQALAYSRWKVKNLQRSGLDYWPQEKGKLLHDAVKLILTQNLDVEEALSQAYQRIQPRGLIQSPRIFLLRHAKLIQILKRFEKYEKLHQIRSQARLVEWDEKEFVWENAEFKLVGRPDRVDENHHGLFLIEYKTGGVSPHGQEMIEQGYRLQLPLYALLVQKKMNREVVGAQFIELTPTGGRTKGIFFETYNGKQEGNWTDIRASSKSLFKENPTVIWERVEKKLMEIGKAYLLGKFKAEPTVTPKEKECSRCQLKELCGYHRF